MLLTDHSKNLFQQTARMKRTFAAFIVLLEDFGARLGRAPKSSGDTMKAANVPLHSSSLLKKVFRVVREQH